MRMQILWASAAAAALAACSNTPSSPHPQASASLQPLVNSGVTGTVKLQQQTDGRVLISALVYGLKPSAKHGFHIHENPSCQDNGEAAGPHFNPLQNTHGAYSTTHHHAGDLPNLQADSQGIAQLNVLSQGLSLTTGTHNAVGRAFVIHAQADDYNSQPNGNSGTRIACGVITSP